MQSTSPAARGLWAAGAIVLTLALVGCGASTDAVVDALAKDAPSIETTTPDSTTVPEGEPTTTVPSETTVPEKPTTTEPSTTEAPPTTRPGSGGGSLPQQAKAAFMESCVAESQDTAACECVWSAIEDEIDVDQLIAAGASETLPPELQEAIVGALLGCVPMS